MIQSFKMALKSIGDNKMRTFLTMLGIIIGVMSLVILVSLVNGATGNVQDTISSLGTNSITVSISDHKGHPVHISDLTEWMEDGVGYIAPVAEESFTGKYEENSDAVEVYGTTAPYFDIAGMNLLLGRFIKTSDVDNNTSVCVVNENLASELVGFTDCIGEYISLNGTRYEIVGVLEDDDESLTSMFGSSSMVVYIPYTSFVRLSSEMTLEVTSFSVAPASDGTVEDTETAITNILLDRFEEDEDAFEVTSTDAIEDAMSSITTILTILLGGIAGISLIVGGIGIMNIMLVTVTERTREIGIRKAIGADRRVILQQFLMEAVVLCMLGCAIGIFLSWGVLQIITIVVSSLELTFEMNGMVVLIAVLFCFAIGVIFGLYPANKAAKMKPIDALHYGG